MENYSSTEDDFIYMLLVGLFLAELAIGAIQLLGAIIRTLILLSKNKPLGKLKMYWIIVLVYFSIFCTLYFTQQYILSSISVKDFNQYNSEDYLLKIKVYSYFMYAYIIWIAMAWLIAIWYCIYIVFNKKSYNMSAISEDIDSIINNEDSIDSTTH
jgi:lysylphosphatidylglycerol synthetase-like protein (DUF2156 family)